MRISIKQGRSRALAIAASVLLSGTALAAAAVPAQAASVSARQAAVPAKPLPPSGVVTVTVPGPTTEPPETPIDLPLTASDTDAAGYPLTWSSDSPALTLL